jgi:tetratricopeptide (TPR) repeat protein
MGVVYEAEQLSLGRHVALKVLPFAATMDPRHLQRFQNEARAAASLEHPHIVPVFGVGCERGVHYYAMKFIDGQSLAELIVGCDPPSRSRPSLPPAGADTQPAAAAPTQAAPRDAAYFRRVAEWGIQAGEALEYAHGLGIVHRDVKPGNLMIDGQGKLWVTDFGLARTATDTGLTMTGDVLGTLRYMSPEQALARHGLVDHRTDVYSLGATLYELLTGRPAIEGQDRQEILRRIAGDEPRPPRALERAVPTDLETVVLKALAKEPAERYATAKELVNDLGCWLEDRPIRARRPGPVQRGAKWIRRHQSLVRVAGLVFLLAVAGLATGAVFLASAYRREARQRQQAEEAREAEARERKRADEGWAEAAKQLATARANLHEAFALASDRELYSGIPFAELEETTLRRVVTVLEKAVTMEPHLIDHRRQLFMRLQDLSVFLEADGRSKEAADAMRQAVVVLDGCLADFPADAEVKLVYPYHLAACLERLGDFLLETDHRGEREKVYARALGLAQLQMKRAPGPHSFWQNVSIWNGLGALHLEAGDLGAARQAFEKALAFMQPKLPDTIARSAGATANLLTQRSRCRIGLGNVLFESGKYDQAAREFTAARQDFESMFAPNSGVADPAWPYARFLVTCPVLELRDPRRALTLARRKLDGPPPAKRKFRQAAFTLISLAAYQTGDWQASLDSIERRGPKGFRDGWCWQVEAMARWQLGQKKAAREAHDAGVRWSMKKNQPPDLDLRRLRAEAAALIEIRAEPKREN